MKMANKKASKTTKNKLINGKDFPVVGIGASAGGLEALEQFFTNMPRDTGMAFIVIQHLDPNHSDLLPELLQRNTKMKVLQATDGTKVEPNHIYIIPPNRSLSLLNGNLHIFDRIQSRGLSLPIDIFFRSLAADKQEKSIAIVLSGMGSDGSLGLKAIKEKNGLVLVQDPASAKFDGMPVSALDAVNADIVAPADELPLKLIALLQNIPESETDPLQEKMSNNNLNKIIILLREHTGHDFSQYKRNTLIRRIERRKGVHELKKMEDYVRFLQENPKEGEILFKELLIGVTSFFRDKPVWEALKDKILPDLISDLPDDYLIRAWIPGCSTGEEAFSLAMVFKEVFATMKDFKKINLQIFATDLDADAIEKARTGFYPKNIDADVSPERIKQFFTTNEGGYAVNSSIREMIVFATQNIIKDPPFSKVDILSCRNMLIYIEPEMQQRVISLFNYSLKPDGILILGTAETTGSANDGFKEIDGKLKIYKRTSSIRTKKLTDFPGSIYSRTYDFDQNSQPKPDNIQVIADQIMLQLFTPSSVLVNDNGDIIYLTGRTGKYIEPAAGKANWNIFAMVKDGIRNELLPAFQKAQQGYSAVILHNIKFSDEKDQAVEITVQRLDKPDQVRGLTIIVFKDIPKEVFNSNGIVIRPRSSKKIKDMQIELQRISEELQSTKEEMQTSQEELKTINEEQQSTNEELQSTNEELNTSKEEMQSLNEELQTVNTELQNKITDLVRTNEDMKNLLNSTDIATLFLDNSLNIRRYTDLVSHLFKIRNSDIGRPFTDLVTDLHYPELPAHTRKVLQTLSYIQNEVPTTDNRWFRIRIMPYRTLEDRIDGLVLTFIDITASKKELDELKKENEELRKKVK